MNFSLNISLFANRKKIAAQKIALEDARKIILKEANFTCIYDRKSRSGYCDFCPIHKNLGWGDGYTSKEYICTKTKEFSK